jgi:protein-tyrosine phosphatase
LRSAYCVLRKKMEHAIRITFLQKGLILGSQSLSQPTTILQKIAKGVRIVAGRLREQGAGTTALWFIERTYRILSGVSPARTSRVAPNLYVGGQHKRRGLKTIAARGITACVDLRREYGDVAHGLALERQLSLPTDDDNTPTIGELQHAAEFIRQSLAEGRGVYIHCANGVGRAPTTAAAYLITAGLTPAQAWATVRKVRPFIRPTAVQREQIERFAQSVRQPA